MYESKKTSLIRSLIQGEMRNLKEESLKNRRKEGKLAESPRRSKDPEPIVRIARYGKGARVYIQPRPPFPKYQTLAIITNSGRVEYLTGQKSIDPKHQRIIDRLEAQAKRGVDIGKKG